MRNLLAYLLAFLISCLAVAVAAPANAANSVNLDEPGVLAQVRRDRPAHAHAIDRIFRAAPALAPGQLAHWLRTTFDARMVSTQLLKTSDPPQARLSFTLGDTWYKATVRLDSAGSLDVPADAPPLK